VLVPGRISAISVILGCVICLLSIRLVQFSCAKEMPQEVPGVLYSLKSVGAGNGLMLLVVLRATGRHCS